MAKATLFLGALWVAAPGCHAQPGYVRVVLQDAAISPSKPNGETWDCCGRIDPRVLVSLSSILTRDRNPNLLPSSVIPLLEPLAQQIAAPDAAGMMQLYVQGLPAQKVDFLGPDDTYNPLFRLSQGGPPALEHVPFRPGIQILGQLWDRDTLGSPDSVGPFSLQFEDLFEAWDKEQVYTVRQSGAVLYVRISVMDES